MADTRKTQVISPLQERERAIADELQRIVKKVQEEVRGGMTLPCDPRDRLVSINTMHNIFDRLDEAVDRLVNERKES